MCYHPFFRLGAPVFKTLFFRLSMAEMGSLKKRGLETGALQKKMAMYYFWGRTGTGTAVVAARRLA